MHIAPCKITEHLFRFLVEPVTGAWIRREDGDRGDVSQRWNSSDEHLAGVSARIALDGRYLIVRHGNPILRAIVELH